MTERDLGKGTEHIVAGPQIPPRHLRPGPYATAAALAAQEGGFSAAETTQRPRDRAGALEALAGNATEEIPQIPAEPTPPPAQTAV